MKALKLTILCSTAFAILGALGGLLSHWQDWAGVGAMTLMGLFLGLVAAPYFDPSAFVFPTIQQSISGSCAGMIVGALGSGSITGVLIGGVVGLFIGATTKFWIEKITFP